MEDLENKIIVKCDNGFQWVQLNSPEARKYERKAMGHSIGLEKTIMHCIEHDEYYMGYDDDNRTTIFSLRDKDNIPHLTVEYDKRFWFDPIMQIRGKGNTKPNEKYYNDIFKLYKEKGINDYYYLTKGESYATAKDKIYIGDEAISACPLNIVFDSVHLSRHSKIKIWKHSVSGNFDSEVRLRIIRSDCRFSGKIEMYNTNTYAILDGKILIGDKAILSCPPDTVFDSVYLRGDSNIKEWIYSVKNSFTALGSKLEYVDPKCEFGGEVYTNIKNINEEKQVMRM